ncbi:hypothetical protein [Kitasatospora sp. NPDC005751]|uniref:hypothetical protein n=1 Tax=Kitasatospora sp. NPDC005751 TaxID=3157064 RepID=UPI00340E9BE2
MFLVPLALGIAVVTDFRGMSRFFMQPTKRAPTAKGPAGPHLLAGWFFIVLSAYALVFSLVKALVG